jgi:dihydroxy-acid dehydratase
MTLRVDDPGLDVKADDVLVLRNAGPKGAPGMPEAGYLPIPKKLARTGVKDMVRISDARMSGTAFGAVVLHVAPESEAGGPLAMVRNGDEILFDGPKRQLELLISPEEMAARTDAWKKARPPPKYSRGYYRLYVQHVLQADQGCDLDFLTGASGSVVDRESH